MKKLDVLRDAWTAFTSQGGRLLAAAIAYSALLSIVPLFILALNVAALFTGEATARATLLTHVARWVGPDATQTISDLLLRAQDSAGRTTIFGAIALVWGATRLFGAVTRSLDMLWGIRVNVEDTLRNKAEKFLERRVRGFLFVLGIGAMLVFLAFTHGAIAMAREWISLPTVAYLAELLISFAVATVLFGATYRVLPSRVVPVRDAAIGGVITAILFTAGAIGLTSYVAHQAAASPFGAATSVILLLLWLHYSAHAFLFGAAITAARARGKGLLPPSGT